MRSYQVERILDTNPIPVAGVIVEPIQAEGGDNHATPYFFQQVDLSHGVLYSNTMTATRDHRQARDYLSCR